MSSDGPVEVLRRGLPRVRAKRPKRKTGCLTCKSRHIRCDEGQPTCQRCVDSQRECQGYGENKKNHHQPPPLIRKKILPKSLVSSGFAPATAKILWSPTSGIRAQKERDYWYFRSFQDAVALELSCGFENDLWSRLVLQATDSVPIFQLTVATAALRQDAQSPWPFELKRTLSHRQYAMQQYGFALRGVRKSLTLGKESLRTALISSLLIFCFENMLGDTAGAVRNVQSALNVVHENLEHQRTQFSNFQPSHLSVPIEEEILNAFMRLDRPAVALLGRLDNASTPVSNRRFGSTFRDFTYTISSKFSTITAARKSLEHIRYRILPKQKPDTDLRTSFTAPKDMPGPVAHLLKSFAVAATYNNTDELLDQLRQWHRAFDDLLQYAESKSGEGLFVPAEILHIQATTFEILLRGFDMSDDYPQSGLPSEEVFHPTRNFRVMESTASSFTHPSFAAARKILKLSRNLVKHPRFTKNFVFDAGVIPCLWIIIMMCPDRDMKQQATQILRSMEGRIECVWDSRTVADTGEKALAMMEERRATSQE